MLLVTSQDGRPNVMTMSWHMMMDFEPPRLACIVSEGDYSFTALRKTGECVIAVPPRTIASKVVKIGNCFGRDTDKIAKFKLATARASSDAAPLLTDCIANLECRVTDDRLVDPYDLFILDVVKAWIDPKQIRAKTIHHRGYGRFVVDGEVITLKSKMR